MNNLQRVFNYQERQVRSVLKDGGLWFVAKDVCEVLDISKYRVFPTWEYLQMGNPQIAERKI